MIKNLIKLANHLDKKGFHKEADYVDWILKEARKKRKSKSKSKSEKNNDEEKSDFPDFSGDGKITQKDILMAKGVIPKPKGKKKNKSKK